MVEAHFITREYSKNRQIKLEKVTVLSVLNNSLNNVSVNQIIIEPNQIREIVPADGNYSTVVLDVKFLEKAGNRPAQQDNQAYIDPRVVVKTNDNIVLIYKKID